MTTSPTTPISTPTIFAKDYAWLKAHAALLVLTAALVGGGVYGTDALIAKHDLAAEERADAKLQTFVTQSNLAQQQLSQTQVQLLQMIQQLQAQNAQLEKQKSVRDVQTQKQVQNDSTLSAQQAAERLATQTQAKPNEVVATGDNVTIDLPITRSLVSDLDLLGTAQADLADTQTQLKNETDLFTKSQATSADQAKVIEDLSLQSHEQILACAAQVKTLKSQARKSKFKWFGIGFVTGFIAGHIW